MKKLFSDIHGQKTAVSILSSHLSSGNLSHAYVILGPNGIGKEYLAREFARYILCEHHTDDDCPSCRNYGHGAHPDFIFLDDEGGLKIQDVREVIERVNLSPNLSKYKVLLFSGAEKMGIEAANALLKTFEEPPKDTVIILTAVSEESLPQTIISRAQKIKLNYRQPDEIVDILAKEFPRAEIEKVVKFSRGNIGETKEMLQGAEHLKRNQAMFADAQKILSGAILMETMQTLQSYDKEKKMPEFFDIFSYLVFESIASDLAGKPTDWLKNHNTPEKVQIGNKILKIYGDLKYNINLRLAMEALILETLQT